MENRKLSGRLRVTVLKSESVTKNRKRYKTENQMTPTVDKNRMDIEVLLRLMNQVTADCKIVLRSTEYEIRKQYIRSAKKSYADALRWAGRLSFRVADVIAFEGCAARLEEVISRLEEQYVDQEVEPQYDGSQAASNVSA
jgi:hypothetical protein